MVITYNMALTLWNTIIHDNGKLTLKRDINFQSKCSLNNLKYKLSINFKSYAGFC